MVGGWFCGLCVLQGAFNGVWRGRNSGDVRAGGGTTDASPDYRRADEISHAGGLDGHDGDGTVRADVQELRSGNGSVSRAGSHRDGGAVREWAGIYFARVASGKSEDEHGKQKFQPKARLTTTPACTPLGEGLRFGQ